MAITQNGTVVTVTATNNVRTDRNELGEAVRLAHSILNGSLEIGPGVHCRQLVSGRAKGGGFSVTLL